MLPLPFGLSLVRHDDCDALVGAGDAQAIEAIRHEQGSEIVELIINLGADVPLKGEVNRTLAHQHTDPVETTTAIGDLRARIGQNDRHAITT